MNDRWVNISEVGEPIIDWDRALNLSLAFDGGGRDANACLAKMLLVVQRSAFDEGFRKGLDTDKSLGEAMLGPAGHA